MSSSNKTLARDFSLKFLFHLRLDARPDFLEELKKAPTPLSLLEQEWSDFNTSYTETDIEHPDNKLPQSSYDYAKSLIKCLLSEIDQFKEAIAPLMEKRSIEKIDQMDLWILLIASAELKISPDTPKNVIINEAVELAKKYGDNDSYSFINAVLDGLVKKG